MRNPEQLYDAYNGDEPFLFVSYSHVDAERVQSVLRVLFLQGMRVWYDQRGEGIPRGMDWGDWIDDRLRKSGAFLVFITNGVEQRPQVLREIEIAIRRREADPSYQALVIFLERVPVTFFPDRIRTFLEKTQCINMYQYGGLTEAFIQQLLGLDIWPDSIADDALRARLGLCAWKERPVPQQEMRERSFDLLEGSDYVYPLAFPSLQQENGLSFYAVRIGQTDPWAVYPLCLDNQWCPISFIEQEAFRAQGLASPQVRDAQYDAQRRELYKGMLHNWQMIINRASMFNSRFFAELYQGDRAEYEAFCKLLTCGALVVYLMHERSPLTTPEFDHDKASFRAWGELCRTHKVYCLRMDWDVDQNNQREADQQLSYAFHNACLTIADNRYRLEELEETLSIPTEARPAFRKRWQDVQKMVVTRDRNASAALTRNQFYRAFVVREGSQVNDCLVDLDKPFAWELKQVVDMNYTLGLPRALSLRPILPDDSWFHSIVTSEMVQNGQYRAVTSDELSCAIGLFVPHFLQKETWMPQKTFRALRLSDIVRLRELKEWTIYLRSVSSGRKRAHLNEIDYYDIAEVYIRYQRFLKAAMESYPEYRWAREEGCLSLIYRFGSVELISVYHGATDRLELSCPRQGEEYAGSVVQKVPLTIDYVCGDALDPAVRDQSLLCELRLFEGVTAESGGKSYRAVVTRLRQMQDRFRCRKAGT